MTVHRRALTTLAVVAAVLALGAQAAYAGIDSPANGSVVREQPTVRGAQPAGDDDIVDRVTVTLTREGGGSPVSAVGCSGSCGGTAGTFSARFDLPLNGTYTAVATAEHDSRNPLDPASRKSSAPVTFGVEVPPAPPRRLVAEPDGANRTVTLSWSPNTEADLVGYQVFRGVDGSTPQPHGSPVGADTTTFVDRVGDGGNMTYQVVAIRRGATSSSVVASTESNTASATIDRTAPPTTTAPSGGSTSGAGGEPAAGTSGSGGPAPGGLRPQAAAAQPLKISPGGRVDLSGFRPNTVPLDLGPAPAPADPGYKDTLPYTLQPQPADEPVVDAGDESALPAGSLTTTTTDTNRRALLTFLAGAMLLFMLSMHLRWLLRRTTPLTG